MVQVGCRSTSVPKRMECHVFAAPQERPCRYHTLMATAVTSRQNEVAIFCFMAPLLLLMEVPVVGPLMFLPASAAAAYLADLLQRLPGPPLSSAPRLDSAAGARM